MTERVTADLSFFTGERLLRMVATALVDLSRRHTPSDPVYQDGVQHAFNHLVLLCLSRGMEPPASVPDMARWAAEKPLREWPLDIPGDVQAAEAYLVDGQTLTPTQECFEWVVPARDAAAEQFENLLMAEALDICRAARAPESYTAFRRLLITRPVLASTQMALLAADIDLAPVHEVIKRSYEAANATYLRGGVYAVCGRCGCLLVPTGSDSYRCELARCRHDGRPRVGQTFGHGGNGGVYHLTRPLRMFIAGPGLAETDLEAHLAKLGLEAEMWPAFDAYDLRITLPDGQVWAIDVKDRANPALLGRGACALPQDPPYDKGFLVVPQYRFVEREDYARIFAAHRPDELATRLELLSDVKLLRRVGSAIRRHTRDAKAAATTTRGHDDA